MYSDNSDRGLVYCLRRFEINQLLNYLTIYLLFCGFNIILYTILVLFIFNNHNNTLDDGK